MSWKGEPEYNIKYCLGRKVDLFQRSPQYRTLDTIDGEPMEFEWNIFRGFTTLQLISKVQEFMTKMGDPSQFKGRIIFMSMFNDIIWGLKIMNRNVLLMPHLCLYLQKDSHLDVGHSSDLDQKRGGIPLPTKKTTRRLGQSR